MRLAPAIAALALVSACGSAPSNPTWTEDVKPILQANCIKCHGKVPRGGAPMDFRLDNYFGGNTADGQAVYGAQLVALFVAERTHAETMPPVVPLSGVQIDTLRNWADTDAPYGDPVDANGPPEIELLQPLADSLDGEGRLVVEYRLTDPDFEVVSGVLEARSDAGNFTVPGELYSGSGSVAFDAASAPEGSYELVALLDDGNLPIGQRHELSLGTVDVVHAGDAAPSVSIRNPAPDQLFPFPPAIADPVGGANCGNGQLDGNEGCDDNNTDNGDGCNAACRIEDGNACLTDADGVIDGSCASRFCDRGTGECTDQSNRVVFEIADLDTAQLDVVVTAVRGDERLELGTFDNLDVGVQSVAFDPPASAAGGGWTIQVGVTDGSRSRSATVRPLVFTSGPSTEDTFDNGIDDLLAQFCSGCHIGGGVEGLARGTSFAFDDLDNVRRGFGGEVYRRVVLEESMPAGSAQLLFDAGRMGSADRERVKLWIEGGAQP